MIKRLLDLKSPITELSGVGSYYATKLYGLGIETVRDLLFYFPFRWDDFSNSMHIAQVLPDQKVTIEAELKSVRTIRSPFKKMAITEAAVSDNTGSLRIVWYNQPYLQKTLAEGTSYRFSGIIKRSKTAIFLQSPSFEASSQKNTQAGGFIPVYHVTGGITPKALRYFIRQAVGMSESLTEYLPDDIINRQNLMPIGSAVKNIHFPADKQALDAARKRLAFDELFIIQLNYQVRKLSWQKMRAIQIRKDIPFLKKIISSLPFSLTDDQKIALWEIISDCDRTIPMNRLLEGDVGSGKTIVAAIACTAIAQRGYQAAFMAPTELLARQHFTEIIRLAKLFKISVALITHSQAIIYDTRKRIVKKDKIAAAINAGKIGIALGTHSLIQKSVSFKKLALVIVDEQHRFGVKQRAHLIKEAVNIRDGSKRTVPHLLSMTATPIPRTLALTIYGDLDISIIKSIPKGRKKIITKVILPDNREAIYSFVKKQIQSGRQAFVICPLIEESDISESKAATVEYQRLKRDIFPDLTIGLLHGKLKPVEKEAVMEKFSKNQLNIIVSTSVVEVGVDVPNATIMLIEGAERFGLSQLHQFRGRVGRGEHQSYCFLFTDSPAAKSWKRIMMLTKTANGFELASRDLRLRGPGEFMGERQSGFSNLVVASLNDTELIKTAREEAEKLVAADPGLAGTPMLKKRIEKFSESVHFE